jgi:hypothetical protein
MDDNVWSDTRLQEERLGERESAQMYLAFLAEPSTPGHDELRTNLS